MDKTWTTYLLLAIGIMLFSVADKTANADDEKSAHTVSFGHTTKMEVFVNKDGSDESEVKVLINGEEYNFTMPEISEGQSKTIMSEDGKEITVKSVSGHNMIWIDGKELSLPAFGDHEMDDEGLSAMIGRSHQLRLTDEVSITANNLSDDVKAAIVDAVQGVLTSYDIDKKVSFSNKLSAIHLIGGDEIGGIKKMQIISNDDIDADVEYKIEQGEHGEHQKIMIIQKKEIKKKDE